MRVPREPACGRSAGHDGYHVADAVPAEHTEQARWIAWSRHVWWIFDRAYCGERTDGKVFVPDELDFCFLLRSHTGPHSYDRPVDVVWPEAVLFELAEDYRHHPAAGGDR